MGRKKEISDEALLEIARSCFIKDGHTLATGAIAKAAGVSQATLFNRFGTKRKLMILALAPRFHKNPSFISSSPDPRAIPLQLVDMGFSLYRQMRENEPGIRVLRSAGVTFEEVQEHIDDFSPRNVMKTLEGWLLAAQEQGRIAPGIQTSTFSMVFAGAIKNLAFDEFFAAVRNDERALTRYITELVDLIWRGLAPKD